MVGLFVFGKREENDLYKIPIPTPCVDRELSPKESVKVARHHLTSDSSADGGGLKALIQVCVPFSCVPIQELFAHTFSKGTIAFSLAFLVGLQVTLDTHRSVLGSVIYFVVCFVRH